MTKKKKFILTVLIALGITFFCNYQYFFAGTENQINSYTSHNSSGSKTLFKFKNIYLNKDYNAVILWDKLLVLLIICYLIAKGLRDDFSQNYSLKISADAKNEDKIFILLFLFLLVLPIARFDNRSSDSYENRVLGRKPVLFTKLVDENQVVIDAMKDNKKAIQKFINPKLFKDNQPDEILNINNNVKKENSKEPLELNINFLKDFEAYVNDRFFLRSIYLNIYRNFTYDLAIIAPHHNSKVIDKKAKWLYRYYLPPSYNKDMDKEEYKILVNEIRNGLNNFREYCNKNNIDFYILIFPEKESIYHTSFVKKNNDKDVINFVKDIDKKNFSFYYKNRVPSTKDVIKLVNRIGKKNYANNNIGIVYSLPKLQQEINSRKLHHYAVEYYLTNSGMFIEYKKSSVYKPNIVFNNDTDIMNQINKIPINSEFGIIFPIDEIQEEAKNNTKGLLYYKTEHHLTDQGTYIGYLKLLSQMRKSPRKGFAVDINNYKHGKNNYVISENRLKYSYGETCPYVGLTERQCEDFLDYEYDYYFYNGSSKIISQRLKEPHLLIEQTHYGKAPDYRMLLIGNSDIERLMNFMSYSFKNTYKLRLNGPSKISREEQYKVLKYYTPVIREIKPDIIVLCLSYDVLINLKDLTNFD